MKRDDAVPVDLTSCRGAEIRPGGRRGFTLIELMLGMTLLSIGLLAIAGMFSTGYTDVAAGGKTTMGANAVRQIFEDLRTIPFNCLGKLNNYNTNSAISQPASETGVCEGTQFATTLDVARKWRYTLAGDGTGWNFTAAEKSRWATMGMGSVPFGAQATITVAADAGSTTLSLVTVSLAIPARPTTQLSTLLTRL